MILNIKFHEIPGISSRVTLATKFLSHTHRHIDTQTDRHFPEIVKSCSRPPKTCKSIKTRKSKISTKPIFSSTYIEESKKVSIECRNWRIPRIVCRRKLWNFEWEPLFSIANIDLPPPQIKIRWFILLFSVVLITDDAIIVNKSECKHTWK